MFKEKVKKYIDDNGLSQNAFSKKLDLNPGAISGYLNGNYKGSVSNLETTLKSFFQLMEIKKKYDTKNQKYVETSVAGAILSVITYCHVQKSMGIIYGDAGIGKTTAINEYERTHEEAVVIRAAVSTSRPFAFLKIFGNIFNCNNKSNRQDELYIKLVRKLKKTERIIIIDEAQRLPYSTLEIIRDLHDECSIPIVLVGNKEVYDKLLGRGEAAFAQLFSRITMRKEFLTRNIRKKDIELLFEDEMPGEAELEYLLRIAKSKWGIRGAIDVYQNAINNNDVTVGGLEQMVKMQNVGIAG